jgi:hypothetical protein
MLYKVLNIFVRQVIIIKMSMSFAQWKAPTLLHSKGNKFNRLQQDCMGIKVGGKRNIS